jgi:hypothetical protein
VRFCDEKIRTCSLFILHHRVLKKLPVIVVERFLFAYQFSTIREKKIFFDCENQNMFIFTPYF